jgi:hypothetical protein
MPDSIPKRKYALFQFDRTMSNTGRKISGKSFTNTAMEKHIPARNEIRYCFEKNRSKGPSFAGIADDDSLPVRRSVMKIKKIPAASICPEDAISIIGRGCHAYKIAFHAGRFLKESNLIRKKHVPISIQTNNDLRPIAFLKSAPAANISCAAGG